MNWRSRLLLPIPNRIEVTWNEEEEVYVVTRDDGLTYDVPASRYDNWVEMLNRVMCNVARNVVDGVIVLTKDEIERALDVIARRSKYMLRKAAEVLIGYVELSSADLEKLGLYADGLTEMFVFPFAVDLKELGDDFSYVWHIIDTLRRTYTVLKINYDIGEIRELRRSKMSRRLVEELVRMRPAENPKTVVALIKLLS